jgi:hypothetical protein
VPTRILGQLESSRQEENTKFHVSMRHASVGLIALATFALTAPALKADAIQISVDTSNYAGDPATVLFDFTAGGSPPANTVTISNVAVPVIFNETDTGSVTGAMPAS